MKNRFSIFFLAFSCSFLTVTDSGIKLFSAASAGGGFNAGSFDNIDSDRSSKQSADFPDCSDDSTDPDGDGFGFENNQSCLVPEPPVVTTTNTVVNVNNSDGHSSGNFNLNNGNNGSEAAGLRGTLNPDGSSIPLEIDDTQDLGPAGLNGFPIGPDGQEAGLVLASSAPEERRGDTNPNNNVAPGVNTPPTPANIGYTVHNNPGGNTNEPVGNPRADNNVAPGAGENDTPAAPAPADFGNTEVTFSDQTVSPTLSDAQLNDSVTQEGGPVIANNLGNGGTGSTDFDSENAGDSLGNGISNGQGDDGTGSESGFSLGEFLSNTFDIGGNHSEGLVHDTDSFGGGADPNLGRIRNVITTPVRGVPDTNTHYNGTCRCSVRGFALPNNLGDRHDAGTGYANYVNKCVIRYGRSRQAHYLQTDSTNGNTGIYTYTNQPATSISIANQDNCTDEIAANDIAASAAPVTTTPIPGPNGSFDNHAYDSSCRCSVDGRPTGNRGTFEAYVEKCVEQFGQPLHPHFMQFYRQGDIITNIPAGSEREALINDCTAADKYVLCDYSNAGPSGHGWNPFAEQSCPPEENPNAAVPVQATPAAPVDNNSGPSNSSDYIPDCSSPDSDSDGDGFGWENGESCIAVASEVTQTPVANNSGSSSNNVTSRRTMPDCASAASDPDNDGYGWENGESCMVVENQGSATPVADNSGATNTTSNFSPSGVPFCANASSDPDGDGWGWENDDSCIVRGSAADN